MIENISPQTPLFYLLLSISIIILVYQGRLSYLSFMQHRVNYLIENGSIKKDLRFGFFLMCGFLFIASFFWTLLNFYLTQFDTNLIYQNEINTIIFKSATLSMGVGSALFIRAIEKNELNGKLMGIPSLLLIGLVIAIAIRPMHNIETFSRIANLQLHMNIFVLFIPLVFLFKAIVKPPKDSRVKNAYLLGAVGTVVFALGANLLNESVMMFMRNSFGTSVIYTMFVSQLILKVSGLTLLFFCVRAIDESRSVITGYVPDYMNA